MVGGVRADEWGGLGGGVGFSKANGAFTYKPKNGTTGEYGIVLKTKDSDINTHELAYNFMAITGKAALKSAPRSSRDNKSYLNDMKVIQEMVWLKRLSICTIVQYLR